MGIGYSFFFSSSSSSSPFYIRVGLRTYKADVDAILKLRIIELSIASSIPAFDVSKNYRNTYTRREYFSRNDKCNELVGLRISFEISSKCLDYDYECFRIFFNPTKGWIYLVNVTADMFYTAINFPFRWFIACFTMTYKDKFTFEIWLFT